MTQATYSETPSRTAGQVYLPQSLTSPSGLMHRITEARSHVLQTQSENPSNALKAVIQNPLTYLSEESELRWPTEPITLEQRLLATRALEEIANAMTTYDLALNRPLIVSLMSTLPAQVGDEGNMKLRLANWLEVMQDVPSGALAEAIRKFLRESTDKFLPSPSVIRNLAKHLENQWLFRARLLTEIAEAPDNPNERPLHLLSAAGMSFSAMTLLFKQSRFEKRDVWVIYMPKQFDIDQAENHVSGTLRKALGEYDFCLEGEEYISREQQQKNLEIIQEALNKMRAK